MDGNTDREGHRTHPKSALETRKRGEGREEKEEGWRRGRGEGEGRGGEGGRRRVGGGEGGGGGRQMRGRSVLPRPLPVSDFEALTEQYILLTLDLTRFF